MNSLCGRIVSSVFRSNDPFVNFFCRGASGGRDADGATSAPNLHGGVNVRSLASDIIGGRKKDDLPRSQIMFDFDVRSGNEPSPYESLGQLMGLGALRGNLSEPVSRIRRRPPVVLAPACSVRDGLATMAAHHASTALIASHGVLLGTLAERDVLRRLLEAAAPLAGVPVFQLMSAETATLSETDTVGYAIRKLWSMGGQPLPIVRASGALFGLLETQDVVAWICDRASLSPVAALAGGRARNR
jgi:CBS domain-containing protein